MKLSTLILAASAAAVPAPNNNHHFHRREASPLVTVLTTQTTVVYLTDGESLTSTEATTETSTIEPTSSASSSASSASSTSTSSTGSSGGVYGDLSHFEEPLGKFEDNKYKCSDGVPVGNGVVSLDWVGIDGWASVMNEAGDTAKQCKPGYWCSYACQAGMSKTQWPLNQPLDGQSRGGLICNADGYLERTNKDTDYLCEWGAQTANAVSKIDKVVSLCRTDYPGSENMVVPTRLEAHGTQPISVIVSEDYFKWEGKPTSSQYYVNDAGVDVEEGCVWGTSDGTIGNWAPVVLGAGQTGGLTYLSIIPNPNNKTPPSYSLKIEGEDGATVVGSCVYSGGSYSGGADGCTVTISSGVGKFVFY